jgi:hypothetical protein
MKGYCLVTSLPINPLRFFLNEWRDFRNFDD